MFCSEKAEHLLIIYGRCRFETKVSLTSYIRLNQDDGALYRISNFSYVILPSQFLQTLDIISAVLLEATQLPVHIQATQ